MLNAIAVGEDRGAQLLAAWAASTDDADLAADLTTVAIREREHAAAFAKRLHELGFAVRPRQTSRFEAHLELAHSAADDCHKFQQLLPERRPGADEASVDPLAHLFDDHSIDPQTGALLGRFIAEERDSERILERARQRTVARSSQPAGSDDELAQIAERIDRLTATLESLKALRQREGRPG